MLIFIDSREKPRAITGIVRYFDEAGIKYATNKLWVGDYMNPERPLLFVDRKQTIQELSTNCCAEHARFRRELERTAQIGGQMVVLVEQNRYGNGTDTKMVREPSDLIGWVSRTGQVTGEKVYRVIVGWQRKYPLTVEFCSKNQTGKRIAEILGGAS